MKTAIAIFMTLALTTVTGYFFDSAKETPQGGTMPKAEKFSITVLPSRGDYFKRDVLMDITTDRIGVIPTTVLARASGAIRSEGELRRIFHV